ncbi:MAG: hypothetical protein H0T99_09275 [Geodermatophilaceae bacterium]|nr:hypothetical protein [Geodermatophilaceae bacterium]
MSKAPHPASGPDLDVLADLSADLLVPADDRAARAHVEACAECSTVLQALERTGSQLRWLPPIAMPPDVVTRIDDALAAEANVVSLDQRRRRGVRRQQLLGVAAAGVIVLGGGGVLFSQLGDGAAGGDVTAGAGNDGTAAVPGDLPDLDQDSLPGAVGGLVDGGEGDEPLRLEGTPPDNCVPNIQIEGVEELIGVIAIRYGGRDRDAVFFSTSDPTVARVYVVDDCSSADAEIVDLVEGQI